MNTYEEPTLERYDAAEPWLRRALPFLEANETEYGLQWRLAHRMIEGSPLRQDARLVAERERRRCRCG